MSIREESAPAVWTPGSPVTDTPPVVEPRTAPADPAEMPVAGAEIEPPEVVAKREFENSKHAKLPDWLIASEPPRGSFNWTLWNAYCRLRLYKFPNVPVPPFWGNLDQRIEENFEFVRHNSNHSMGIVGVISVKGGVLKTTTATWFGAENCRCTSIAGLTVVVDADSGGVESATERYEVEADDWFLTTSEAAHKILRLNWVPTAQQIVTFTARHEESGARVMTMDNSNLSRFDMRKMLKALKPAAHTVIVDSGPGTKETNTYGITDVATLLVIPTVYDNASATKAVHQTLDLEGYHIRERLAKGDDVILAIHAVEPKDFNRRYQYEQAKKFGLAPHQVVLFPLDKYISKARPVHRGKVSKKFLFALSDFQRACAEAAMRWNEKYPEKLLPGDELSDGQPATDETQTGATPVSPEGSVS